MSDEARTGDADAEREPPWVTEDDQHQQRRVFAFFNATLHEDTDVSFLTANLGNDM